jgi:hypothetical protein
MSRTVVELTTSRKAGTAKELADVEELAGLLHVSVGELLEWLASNHVRVELRESVLLAPRAELEKLVSAEQVEQVRAWRARQALWRGTAQQGEAVRSAQEWLDETAALTQTALDALGR